MFKVNYLWTFLPVAPLVVATAVVSPMAFCRRRPTCTSSTTRISVSNSSAIVEYGYFWAVVKNACKMGEQKWKEVMLGCGFTFYKFLLERLISYTSKNDIVFPASNPAHFIIDSVVKIFHAIGIGITAAAHNNIVTPEIPKPLQIYR